MSGNPMRHSSFSAVIPTCDRPEALARCLRSIVAQTRRPAQVTVVDDGQLDSEPLRRLVEEAGIEWTYLKKDRLDRNRSRNLGVEASKHPIVAFLDDDVVLDPDYFDRLIDVLERFARVGVVGASARVYNQRRRSRLRPVRHAAERLFLVRGKRLGALMRSGFCADIQDDDEVGVEPFDVEFASSGACAYFREVCRRYPYPEGHSFLAEGDDKIFSLRITRQWRTLFVPRAKAAHLHASSGRPSPVLSGQKTLLGIYWTHRQFARRGPLDLLLFLWGSLGLILICAGGAVERRRKRHWQFAWGLVHGLGKALGFELRGTSMREAVEQAAALRGEPIVSPVGLEGPFLAEPQEIPPGGWPFAQGAGNGEP